MQLEGCVLVECQQGSQEWHQARAGVITASMFTVARGRVGMLTAQQQFYVDAILSGKDEKQAMEIAGYKAKPASDGIKKAIRGEKVGDFSDEAKNYAFRLAIERISGQPLDNGFETWQMKRGHELEPLARMEHAAKTGLFINEAGFIKTEDGVFGASADGLIDKDGGSEYKCFLAPEKLRQFHIDNDASGVMDQVQGCMWITGRKWWAIGMYCPALESVGKQLWLKNFERDDEYIAAMEIELCEFKALVDEYEQKLRAD